MYFTWCVWTLYARTLKHNQTSNWQICVFLFFLSRLSWFDGSGMGFCLEYPTIGLHAISRDVSAYPQEHLYVMVNGKLGGEKINHFYCRSRRCLEKSHLPSIFHLLLKVPSSEHMLILFFVCLYNPCREKYLLSNVHKTKSSVFTSRSLLCFVSCAHTHEDAHVHMRYTFLPTISVQFETGGLSACFCLYEFLTVCVCVTCMISPSPLSQMRMRQKWQRKQMMMKKTPASAAAMMTMTKEWSQRFDLYPAIRRHVSDKAEDQIQILFCCFLMPEPESYFYAFGHHSDQFWSF